MVDMTCCAVLRADVRWAWTACGAVWLPNAKPELKLRDRFIERERVMRFRAHEHGMRILNHNAYVPVGRAPRSDSRHYVLEMLRNPNRGRMLSTWSLHIPL